MSTPTHTDLARMYLGSHHSDTIYTRGEWHRYKDGVWSPAHDLVIKREIREVLESQQQEKVRPTSSMILSVEAILKGHLYVADERMDASPDLVNLTNGVYSLGRDNGLMPHNPKHYLTTQLPFEFDHDAVCPTWDMYLLSTFVLPQTTTPDQELIHFVQEAIGYSLTVDIRHHVTFWCLGSGANGKGVMFHILEALAGGAAIPFNVDLLHREQYQLATLAGKRVALCAEVQATKNLVQDALVKSLVAGDPMSVRMIRREPFTLHPTVKLWWAINKLPAVADTTEGFWRRIMVVPFNRQFGPDERILDLKDLLVPELSGIFSWAMKGLQRLRRRGKFEVPQQVLELTAQYRHESNPIELFIEDTCNVDFDDISFLAQAKPLYIAYKEWCQEYGYKPLSNRNFKQEMERIGHYTKRLSVGIHYVGVQLKPANLWGP